MKHIREKSSGALAQLLREAVEARNRQEYAHSAALLEQAHKMVPANAAVLLDLGFARGLLYDYAAAERCFDQAVHRAHQKAEALAMAGLHCRNFMRYEMSRHYFAQATQQPINQP